MSTGHGIRSDSVLASPPTMIPPGHHAWSWFIRFVLSAGYSAAISGLIVASVQPQPIPISTTPSRSTVAPTSPPIGAAHVSPVPPTNATAAAINPPRIVRRSSRGLTTISVKANAVKARPSTPAISAADPAGSVASNRAARIAPAVPARSDAAKPAVNSAADAILSR